MILYVSLKLSMAVAPLPVALRRVPSKARTAVFNQFGWKWRLFHRVSMVTCHRGALRPRVRQHFLLTVQRGCGGGTRDSGNNIVRRVFANGSITTVAGTRQAGYNGASVTVGLTIGCLFASRAFSTGDGRSPTNARLFTPSSAITDGVFTWISEVSLKPVHRREYHYLY